jgi:glutamate formiminotransferase
VVPPRPIVECVPNVSEGRDAARLARIAAAVRAVPRVTLADVHADPDHHRAVFTFLGEPRAVGDAALALADIVLAEIDMRQHRGIHPRIGALDVLPFVPLTDTTMADAIALARETGRALAERHALRAYDAVHLASALALADPDVVVATWDQNLRAAAAAEGFTVAA